MANIVIYTAVLAAIFASAFANCPSQWTEWGGSCYRFQNQYRETWADAEKVCQSEGGSLVSIGTTDENTFLFNWWVSMLNPLDGTAYQYVWIGYNDIESEGNWEWSNGNPNTFEKWGGKQPDGGDTHNCATMLTKVSDDVGKWDDGNCTSRRSYICEINAVVE